jgi:hypothetical protein
MVPGGKLCGAVGLQWHVAANRPAITSRREVGSIGPDLWYSRRPGGQFWQPGETMKQLTVVLILASTLIACGGGPTAPASGGPGSSSAPAPVQLDGAYLGSYAVQGVSGSIPVLGAISTTAFTKGFGFFVDDAGFIYVFPSFSSGNDISEAMEGYASGSETFPGGATSAGFTATGQATNPSAPNVTGSFTGNGEQGALSLSSQPIASETLANLAGSYSGAYFGSSTSSVTVVIASDGTISGGDGFGCSFTGTVKPQPGNLFSFVATNAVGASCFDVLGGLAFVTTGTPLVSGFPSGTLLYAGWQGATGSGAEGAFAAVMVKQQ